MGSGLREGPSPVTNLVPTLHGGQRLILSPCEMARRGGHTHLPLHLSLRQGVLMPGSWGLATPRLAPRLAPPLLCRPPPGVADPELQAAVGGGRWPGSSHPLSWASVLEPQPTSIGGKGVPGPGCHCPGHGGPRALGQPTLLCVRGAHGHRQDGVAPWTGPAQSQESQHQAGGHCQLGTEGGGTGRWLSRAGQPQDTGAHGQLSRSWDGRARGPRGPPAQGKGPEVQGWTSPRPRFLGTAAEHEPPLPGVHSAARSLTSLGTVPRRWAGSAVQGRTRPGRAERMPPHTTPVLAGRPVLPTPPPPRWLEAARVCRMLHGGSPSHVCAPACAAATGRPRAAWGHPRGTASCLISANPAGS